MKQQISVTKIYKHGNESESILKAIGNMNEGKGFFSARDLEGYFNFRNAQYPSTASNAKLIKDETDANTYHVKEGEAIVLTLEWVEVYELATENSLP